jgi:hypothetical protein
VAHLAGEQFMAFFGLLPARDVQESAKHRPLDDTYVSTLTACGNPANFVI